MKQVFTLFFLSLLVFSTTALQAQVTENFSTTTPARCIIYNVMARSSSGGSSNSASATFNSASAPATGTVATAYIDIAAATTISAFYNVTGNFNGSSSSSKFSKIEIGILNKSGVFTPLNTVTVNSSSTSATGTISGTITTAGTYRIQVRVTEGNNANTTFIDDIKTLAGTYHYTNGACNTVPTPKNDVFNASTVTAPVSGNVLTNTNPNGADTDPNSETLSAVPQTNVALSSGTLNLASNGSFTFTPNSSFRGGSITFSYTITDNGFDPLTSTASVTINYPSAPTAKNDAYTSAILGANISGNVVSNDTDPNTAAPFNATAPTATLVSGPTHAGGGGTVPADFTFNSNGNFNFQPKTGFTGGDVTFTYKISDNTFSPYFSNTATVTLTYPSGAILPIKLLSISGSIVNNRVQITWSVADNETGNYFEIQKSSDGKNFTAGGLLFASKKSGAENYTFVDPSKSGEATCYRLKIVNNDRSVSYSKVIVIRTQTGKAKDRITLFQNPVSNMLTFTYHSLSSGVYRINIYTAGGVKINTSTTTFTKGLNTISISLNNAINAGTYIAEVTNGEDSNTIKFIKE